MKKQMNVNSRIYCFLLIVGILAINCNNVPASNNDPINVVKKYIDSDLQGVRLSGETYNQIESLILWEHEPGWDQFFVSRNVNIRSSTMHENQATVEVVYEVICIVSGNSLNRYHFNELIEIHLTLIDGEWKIVKPIFPPHVSQQVAREHYYSLYKNDVKGMFAEDYKDIVNKLDELRDYYAKTSNETEQ